MPPTSSPVPRLSSVPSDASTVHAIASRSPGRTTNKGEGRAVTLHRLCVDAIATTSPPHRHRSTSNQTDSHAGCLSSCSPRPRPRPLHSGGEEGQSKRASSMKRRERTMAKDAADLFARSSPRLCSVCCPHRPHYRQPFTTSPPSHQQSGRGKGAHHVRLWVIPSIPHRHHLATDRPATRRAAPRSVCHPARLVLFPVLFPSIRWCR